MGKKSEFSEVRRGVWSLLSSAARTLPLRQTQLTVKQDEEFQDCFPLRSSSSCIRATYISSANRWEITIQGELAILYLNTKIDDFLKK